MQALAGNNRQLWRGGKRRRRSPSDGCVEDAKSSRDDRIVGGVFYLFLQKPK